MKLDTMPCPECQAPIRPEWKTSWGEQAEAHCDACGADLVFRAYTEVVVTDLTYLYDDRHSVQCAFCPTVIDERKAAIDAASGYAICAACVRRIAREASEVEA